MYTREELKQVTLMKTKEVKNRNTYFEKFRNAEYLFDIRYKWMSVSRVFESSIALIFWDGSTPYTKTYSFDSPEIVLLSTTEYTLQGWSDEVETLPKRGSIVWVKNPDDEFWVKRQFLEFFYGSYVTIDCNEFDGECVKYNNKQMTTINPYKDDK